MAADTAAEVERQDRRQEALRLRVVESLTVREIAKRLGVCKSTAHEDLDKALAERGQETKEQLRAIANARLDAVFAGHVARAQDGSAKSAQVVIQAERVSARINGYEAPKQVELSGKVETRTPHDELLDKLAGIAARVAAAAGKGEGGTEPDGGAG